MVNGEYIACIKLFWDLFWDYFELALSWFIRFNSSIEIIFAVISLQLILQNRSAIIYNYNIRLIRTDRNGSSEVKTIVSIALCILKHIVQHAVSVKCVKISWFHEMYFSLLLSTINIAISLNDISDTRQASCSAKISFLHFYYLYWWFAECVSDLQNKKWIRAMEFM